MVERLTAALEKARTSRAEHEPDAVLLSGDEIKLPVRADMDWREIPEAELDPAELDAARVAMSGRDNRLAAGLEILRTKLVGICQQNGWRRIAFVPTSAGCGATTLGLNLAMTIGQTGDLRVLLADLDFASPSIADRLKIANAVLLREVLERTRSPEDALCRLGDNLILMTNKGQLRRREISAFGLKLRNLLQHLQTRLRPDLLFMDLPPIFTGGDSAALLSDADAAFQIAAANQTTATEIAECAEVIAGSTAYLGVILNQCADQNCRRLADVAA